VNNSINSDVIIEEEKNSNYNSAAKPKSIKMTNIKLKDPSKKVKINNLMSPKLSESGSKGDGNTLKTTLNQKKENIKKNENKMKLQDKKNVGF
jgi:hypothetical protein